MKDVSSRILGPEDYAEPRCLLCEEPYGSRPEIKAVPQKRIIEKMNEYMSRRDYEGAQRHLLYWLEEAKLGRDLGGELMILNELVGHYRKTSRKEQALAAAAGALELVERLDFDGTISAGTTFINAATACQAFDESERAMELFEKARRIYEEKDGTDPQLLGGLYNNMALACVSLERFDEAWDLYGKAMKVMETVPGGKLEQAITCLNMADLVEAQTGMEEGEKQIGELLDRAGELLKDPDLPRDGYYAFVCEKCAPSFSWYGYFLEAEELTRLSEEIYERNGAGGRVL